MLEERVWFLKANLNARTQKTVPNTADATILLAIYIGKNYTSILIQKTALGISRGKISRNASPSRSRPNTPLKCNSYAEPITANFDKPVLAINRSCLFSNPSPCPLPQGERGTAALLLLHDPNIAKRFRIAAVVL
jgi:hypothetical protein